MDNRVEGRLRGCLLTYFSTNEFFNKYTHIDDDEKSYVIPNIVNDVVSAIKNANFKTVEKFLFVEDGSVDLDVLDSLAVTNPEVKVLVVRQGGRVPELKEVK